MRTELAPYLNQYVLCKGWINSWEDLEDVKRVCVSQPTIRKPDKHVLFENQERIATVHHLNLFIKWEDLSDYNCEFTIHTPIEFTGFINRYIRSDGTEDYGIFPTKQSTLHYRFNVISQLGLYIAENAAYSADMLYYCREIALPTLCNSCLEIENAGNYLPTFELTYEDWREVLSTWIEGVEHVSQKIENACKSRASRRLFNIKKDFTKDYKETIDRKILLQRLSNSFEPKTKSKSTTRGLGFKQYTNSN